MKRILTAIAGITALALSAEAQTYRCEHGELVGGVEGETAKCTVNSAGQITSVTPYRSVQSAPRSNVKIYPSNQVHSAPVKTYSPAKRTYAPTALTAQSPKSTSITSRTYQPQNVRQISPTGNVYYNQNGSGYRATQPQIITAAPTSRIQRAAYAAPCNFKIRELPTRSGINTYEVCYSDIQATDRRGLSKIYARIKKASKRACGTDYHSVLTRWSAANNRCVSESLDRAVMSSGLDPLRAYHLAKTGKGVPTVYVGQPRNAF